MEFSTKEKILSQKISQKVMKQKRKYSSASVKHLCLIALTKRSLKLL